MCNVCKHTHGPDYCNSATGYLGFPVSGFFEAANALFIATVTFLQKQKKGNTNRGTVQSASSACPYLSLGWREGSWSMKGSTYCCSIFKSCENNALSWESSVFAKGHSEKQSGPTLIDRVHNVCCKGENAYSFLTTSSIIELQQYQECQHQKHVLLRQSCK